MSASFDDANGWIHCRLTGISSSNCLTFSILTSGLTGSVDMGEPDAEEIKLRELLNKEKAT